MFSIDIEERRCVTYSRQLLGSANRGWETNRVDGEIASTHISSQVVEIAVVSNCGFVVNTIILNTFHMEVNDNDVSVTRATVPLC